MLSLALLAASVTSTLFGGYYLGSRSSLLLSTNVVTPHSDPRWNCDPFLPNLFATDPPHADDPLIRAATDAVRRELSARFAELDIDSLSVAVVTSAGPIFEQNWGVLRANESDSPPVTSNSSYRIASVSKLFAAFEGWVLQQKGRLSWEDEVRKYFPDFQYRLDGFDESEDTPSMDEYPITISQLASHTSGLGRDWPAGTATDWPNSTEGGGPPPVNGLPFPTADAVFAAIASTRMTYPPSFYPMYSNTGTGLLGLTLVAANRFHGGPSEPGTYAELMHRDVFAPLGLSGSHFAAAPDNAAAIVVPRAEPDVVDLDFDDAMHAGGGQFASLADFVALSRTLLDPHAPGALLSPHTVAKWLRPVHAFEEDHWTEVGLVWEIVQQEDSNGRPRKIYWKLGSVAGFNSALALHPGSGYGVSLLMSGGYADAAALAYGVFAAMQPAMDAALARAAGTLYAGRWASADGASRARVVVDKGTLFVEALVLRGADALRTLGAAEGARVALRSAGRRDEFRLDAGRPETNGRRYMGCMSHWAGVDELPMLNGAAINAVYFSGRDEGRRLHVPSLNIEMYRR